MKYLYKYPQAEFPYADLVETSQRRSRTECEYELIDTGVFDQNRYFDIFVEYAKASPEDMLIQISIYNRGPKAAELNVLPTLWFRNQWSWQSASNRPTLEQLAAGPNSSVIKAVDPKLGTRFLYCDGFAQLLFTENETNTQRIFGVPNLSPYVKDGIHEYVVHGHEEAVNPEMRGTKAAACYRLAVPPSECSVVRLRLSDVAPDAWAATDGKRSRAFGTEFDEVLQTRRREADKFYADDHPFRHSAPTQPTSCARRWPACSGASSSTTTTWTSGWKNADRIRSGQRAKRRPATTGGTTCTTAT